jgi:hypothetical protein
MPFHFHDGGEVEKRGVANDRKFQAPTGRCSSILAQPAWLSAAVGDGESVRSKYWQSQWLLLKSPAWVRALATLRALGPSWLFHTRAASCGVTETDSSTIYIVSNRATGCYTSA